MSSLNEKTTSYEDEHELSYAEDEALKFRPSATQKGGCETASNLPEAIHQNTQSNKSIFHWRTGLILSSTGPSIDDGAQASNSEFVGYQRAVKAVKDYKDNSNVETDKPKAQAIDIDNGRKSPKGGGSTKKLSRTGGKNARRRRSRRLKQEKAMKKGKRNIKLCKDEQQDQVSRTENEVIRSEDGSMPCQGDGAGHSSKNDQKAEAVMCNNMPEKVVFLIYNYIYRVRCIIYLECHALIHLTL